MSFIVPENICFSTYVRAGGVPDWLIAANLLFAHAIQAQAALENKDLIPFREKWGHTRRLYSYLIPSLSGHF
jgi:hypothetical protein